MAEHVRFSRSLYLLEAVQAAINAYERLGRFELYPHADYIEVRIDEPDPDVGSIVVDEFCNHVLHETIVRRRG